MQSLTPNWVIQFVAPVAGSLIAGGLIGFEREYRGRAAGLRTHMLMCLASALLMLAAVHQLDWFTYAPTDTIRADPVRMAHGILTGIGFLCGGVIFRQGLSVHGLTTAASLWITSSLGILFGVGSYGLAVSGTIATLVVLAALRSLDDMLPKEEVLDLILRYRTADAPAPSELRAFMRDLGFSASAADVKLFHDGADMEFAMHLKTSHRHGAEVLVARLRAEPKLVGFEVSPRRD